MRRLIQRYRKWREAAYERARMARVEEELRIQRELEYLNTRQASAGKTLTVSTPELMGQSINSLNQRL
ncbi:hypothetical protein [Burkholderia phage FLC9]|nr:hypothetical protein [Burkholderia phage FLC9]